MKVIIGLFGSSLLFPEGSGPCGAECGVVAWIHDSSDQGALDSSWGSACRILRGRIPLGCGLLPRETQMGRCPAGHGYATYWMAVEGQIGQAPAWRAHRST